MAFDGIRRLAGAECLIVPQTARELMMRFVGPVLLLSLACLLTLPGCRGSDRSPLGKVTGTVNYKGQPIASGTIIFEVPGARPANGKIVGGKIQEVTTHDPNDGVPVGQAKIAVFATEAPASPAAAPSDPGQPIAVDENYMGGSKSLIPAKYNDPATSGLTWEIKKGDNTVTLDLTD
jgi:hypothetical protein